MTTDGLSITRTSAGGPGAGVTSQPVRRIARIPAARRFTVDALVITVAVLDVWLVIPEGAPNYTVVLSLIACASLAARQWFPFTVVLATLPGFLMGWSQVAAMLALGLLATRKQWHGQVWTATALVWLCRFFSWPPQHFVTLTWREHVLAGLYALIVAGMPVAIGLLIGARAELAARLAELAASRDRERRLHAQAVRAEERAKLARDMHDIVSHDITLIAMQAGGLSVAATNDDTRETARTIRQLSTHTLEELRCLLGMLRSEGMGHADDRKPDITEVRQLIRATAVSAELDMPGLPDQLPPNVSVAAYRTVQECLTNVGKHAPGAHASVAIHHTGDALCVRVSNGPGRTHTAEPFPSGGHGLAGLAERARLLGGTLKSGPTDEGGFVVTAHYPMSSPP